MSSKTPTLRSLDGRRRGLQVYDESPRPGRDDVLPLGDDPPPRRLLVEDTPSVDDAFVLGRPGSFVRAGVVAEDHAPHQVVVLETDRVIAPLLGREVVPVRPPARRVDTGAETVEEATTAVPGGLHIQVPPEMTPKHGPKDP